ncbi:MAG TPA: hypothetical protein VIE44_00760 [Methylomirabilota bacterium]|jgi:hypothetical protein
MTQQGFDPVFGHRGTCASHVAGFGGWPLGLVVGVDGRATMICSAPDQRTADQGITPGGRFRGVPVTTLRIVSFPPNGQPVGLGSTGTAVSIDPPADEPIYPVRTITRPDRIAVLGAVTRANRTVPTLWVFAAGPINYGVAKWGLERKSELANLASVGVERCGLGWAGGDGDVVVVAPTLTFVPGRPGRPPQPPGWVLRLVVHEEGDQPGRRPVNVPIRQGLDLPDGFAVTPRVGAVCTDRGDGLLVGLSFEGLDPQGGLRPVGWFDAARAAVVRLRRSASGLARKGLEPDPGFGQEGVWVATAADGEITTVDRMDLDEPARLVVAGRARRAGAWSLHAASLDPAAGTLAWFRYPGVGALGRVTGLALDGGRVLLCGSTHEFFRDAAADALGEAIVACLSADDGQPDAGFGVGGLARYRLNGATYATALAVTRTGESLVACALRWGWSASVAAFHAGLSRLSAAGSLDGGFGSAGVLRHDGLGEASRVAVNQAGRVWSAGVKKIYSGMVPGYHPWDPEKPAFRSVLTVSQLSAAGELSSAFGLEGIVDHQLDTRLPAGQTEFELASLVPLASGGAILTGPYFERVLVNTVTGETGLEFHGSWILRLTPGGGSDPGFGTGGLRTYPARAIELVQELADGSLQGYESSVPLRLAASGDPAPGFGPNGVKAITKSPVTMPLDVEPDGEWFAPVWGRISPTSMRWMIGLVRCRPDGVVDPGFGAGAATPPDSCLVDVASVQGAGFNPNWNDEGGPHQTLRLADGTLLTIWSLSWQQGTSSFRPWGMVLVAWTADGLPRAVAAWGGKPAKAIPNPLGRPPLGSPATGWLGWRNQCAVLQPDGSILVGMAGDDANETRANQTPRPLRQSAYFSRLVPPGFDLDPGLGLAGFLVRRLPDDGYRSAQNLVDSQVPERLALVGANAVVAAIACRAVHQSLLSQGGLADSLTGSPNLPFDGSVGVARLI